MKWTLLFRFQLLVFVVWMTGGLAHGQTLDSANTLIIDVVNQNSRSAVISWQQVNPGITYHLYRRFPNTDAFAEFATTQQTHFTDSILRSMCHDTVIYYVACQNADVHYVSNQKGAVFFDSNPTTACALRVVTVDEASQHLQLSWERSPDDDILGYFICTGTPCMELDTVWGADNTSYTASSLNSTDIHTFRIYAFDSCFSASALTDSYNNMVLNVASADCSTTITAQWNRYVAMPDSVGEYLLYLKCDGGAYQPIATVGAEEPLSVTYNVAPSVSQIWLKVEVVNTTHTLSAFSNVVVYNFSTADSAEYIYMRQVSVTDDETAIRITGDVDAAFEASGYTLYRSTNGGDYAVCARLPYTGQSALDYTDRSVDLRNNTYTYRFGVMDGCGRNEKRSNESNVVLLSLMNEASVPGKVLLQWLPYTGWNGITEYRVMRKTLSAIQWDLVGLTTSTDYEDDVSMLVNLAEPMQYKVTAWESAASGSGFNDSVQSQSVQYSRDATVWFPNAFTPDESSNNNFCITYSFINTDDFELSIYNRAGILVFHTTNPTECWNGTYRNNPLPPAAYTYIAYCHFSNNTVHYIKGTVILIR